MGKKFIQDKFRIQINYIKILDVLIECEKSSTHFNLKHLINLIRYRVRKYENFYSIKQYRSVILLKIFFFKEARYSN